MIIIVSIFTLIWILSFIYIGVADIHIMLGGVVVFFYMLPIASFLSLKYRELAAVIWSKILILSGFVIVNYLHSYFMTKHVDINFFMLIYVILIPVWFVLCGFFYMIQSFLQSVHAKQYKEPGDTKIIKYFLGFMALLIGASLLIVVPLLDYFGNRQDINSIGYEVGMGAAVITFLYFLLESRRVTDETLNYFARPFHRYRVNLKKIKKYLILVTCIFITISLLDELYYRKHWMIWGETIILFIISNIVLFRFGKVIFMPPISANERPDKMYLPSVRSKRTVIIIAICLIFAMVCAIAK